MGWVIISDVKGAAPSCEAAQTNHGHPSVKAHFIKSELWHGNVLLLNGLWAIDFPRQKRSLGLMLLSLSKLIRYSKLFLLHSNFRKNVNHVLIVSLKYPEKFTITYKTRAMKKLASGLILSLLSTTYACLECFYLRQFCDAHPQIKGHKTELN